MNTLHLLTIPISPYCEKIRWALDLFEIPYIEERHLQVFHYLRSFRLGRVPNVPVLIDGDTTITDSTAILKHLDRYIPPQSSLYPERSRAEIDTWEELFDETLGIESRRWVYFHAVRTPRMALRTSSQGVPAWQAKIAPWCYPLLKAYLIRHLGADAEHVRAGLEISRGVIARVDTALADGRPFLTGDRFTAADLTFACMMAPFVMPPEYGVRLPQPDEVSTAMRATIEEMRGTRAGQFALKLYRSHRQPCATMQDTADPDMATA